MRQKQPFGPPFSAALCAKTDPIFHGIGLEEVALNTFRGWVMRTYAAGYCHGLAHGILIAMVAAVITAAIVLAW